MKLSTLLGTVACLLTALLLIAAATNTAPPPQLAKLPPYTNGIPLQSAPPQPPAIQPLGAFIEGVRIGAQLGRRNPDMTDSMLAQAAQEIWARQFGAAP